MSKIPYKLGQLTTGSILISEKTEYDEVYLKKLRVVSKGDSSQILYRNSENEVFFLISTDIMGTYNTYQDAEAALMSHEETDEEVFCYLISGPEHRYGSETCVYDTDGLPEIELESEVYDESPEYEILFNAKKEMISSYFFDTDNPGGVRLQNEIELKPGDKAWMIDTYHTYDSKLFSHVEIVLPVEIVGKDGIEKYFAWNNNITRDGLIIKPLITFKCNWGEYPERDSEVAPRIELLPYNIIRL